MKNKLILSLAGLACGFSANTLDAAALNILYVAGSDNSGYKTFATSGQFIGSTWTFLTSGTTGNTIGGDLDRTTTLGPGATSITVKSYMESFDLVIVGLPVSSGNFIDQASGADWAGTDVPILFNAALAARSFTTSDIVANRRVGLVSGDGAISGLTFSNANETTRVSSSALSDRLFAGTSAQNNLYTNTQTDTLNAVGTIGTGEQITTVTNGTATGHGLVFWGVGSTDSYSRTLVNSRALFSLKAGGAGGLSDLNADGQIVLGNLINELTTTAVPEPSSFAAVAGVAALGWVASRRRRSV